MIKKKKKGLGRGLSALFGDEKSENKPKTKNIASNTKALIGDLTRNPYQPRQIFSEEKLEELSNSIKKYGIIQPIAVRPNKSKDGKYEIVAGELSEKLKRLSEENSMDQVLIDADKTCTYGDVMEILDIVKQAGVNSIGLAVNRRDING